MQLLLLVAQHGTKWSSIRKAGFPDRSTLQIKNRYNSQIRKRYNTDDDELTKATIFTLTASPSKLLEEQEDAEEG